VAEELARLSMASRWRESVGKPDGRRATIHLPMALGCSRTSGGSGGLSWLASGVNPWNAWLRTWACQGGRSLVFWRCAEREAPGCSMSASFRPPLCQILDE
jgi:hypothetical protein